jgi:hypothetical protein
MVGIRALDATAGGHHGHPRSSSAASSRLGNAKSPFARFVEDVGVTGRGRYDFETSAIDANVALVVDGSFGQVQVRGVWYGPGATTLTIDGHIGGRRIVAQLPAT